MPVAAEELMEKLVALTKRRGFLFQSSELYGGILMHPMVWKASGHVSNFADPMVDCKKCKKRYRVDEIDPEYETTGVAPTVCPDPKCKGELTPARKFNLMFETFLGPVAESAANPSLSPATAQAIFTNFV